MKPFFKNFWPGIVWLCVIFLVTLAPGTYFPKVSNFWNLFSPDKLIHLSIFSVLAYLLLWGSYKQYKAIASRYTVVIPLIATIFTGILTELLQAYIPIGRDASIYDTIANFAGCFAGYLIFRVHKNKCWEKPVANKNIL